MVPVPSTWTNYFQPLDTKVTKSSKAWFSYIVIHRRSSPIQYFLMIGEHPRWSATIPDGRGSSPMKKDHFVAPMFQWKLESSLAMVYVQCVPWRELEIQTHLLSIIVLLRKKKCLLQSKKYKKKQFWVRRICQARNELGHFNTLVQEMRLQDREYFFR